MGLLVNGEWKDQWYDTKSTGGRFVRSNAQCASCAATLNSGSG
jgi:glutathionyl-hydroquinone reductase